MQSFVLVLRYASYFRIFSGWVLRAPSTAGAFKHEAKTFASSWRGVAWAKPQSELRGRSAAIAQHESSLKSGRRAMLRRLVSVVGLLAASTGGFIGSRPAPTRSSPRFAEKRKPGQRGSARAKERLRKALEKEGAPPPRERLREELAAERGATPAPAPVAATTTTIPSRVELET